MKRYKERMKQTGQLFRRRCVSARKITACVLALCMAFTTIPVNVFAAEGGHTGLCEHHTSHNAECGYIEAVKGHPCGHEHTADCYTDELICGLEEETVLTASDSDAPHTHTQECYALDCPHDRGEHDEACGYVKGVKGKACGYVCEICGREQEECSCSVLCTEDAVNSDCPVCGKKNADLAVCRGEKKAPAPDPSEKTYIITAFDELDETVRSQTVLSGTKQADLNLPHTLAVTGGLVSEDAQAAPGALTVERVQWESAPAYDDEAEGIYSFTAVLPDGYTVEDGVSLPKITVTVEAEQTAAEQVIAMIDALPAVDEIYETAPGENEEGYDAWLAKMQETVKAIHAAKAAYDALSDEEQAAVGEEKVEKLLELYDLAEKLSMADPLEGEITDLDALQKAIGDSNGTQENPTEIVISGNISVDKEITVDGKHIKLTGGTLTRASGFTGYMINAKNGSSLTLANITLDGNKTNANSGILINLQTTALILENKAILTNNPGTAISIYFYFPSSGPSSITMNGGEISNNASKRSGGAIMDEAGDTVITIKGGKITGNSANGSGNYDTYGGAIYSSGTLIIEGGEITGNAVPNGRGGGIFKTGGSEKKFSVTGGSIKDNTALPGDYLGGSGDNVYVNQCAFTLGGEANIPNGLHLNLGEYSTFSISSRLQNPVEIDGIYKKPSAGYKEIVASGTSGYEITKDDLAKFSYVDKDFGFVLEDKQIKLVNLLPATYAVTINVNKDNETWSDHGKTFKLVSGSTIVTDLDAVENGTYDVYEGGTDTGVDVTVEGADVTATVDYYTVTFYDEDAAYGEQTPQAPQIVLKNGKAAKPVSDPSKKDYIFKEWVTADGGDTAFDFSDTAITAAASVFAKWAPVEVYTITAAPASKDFGTETVGYTALAEQTITVTNTGNASVTLLQPTSTDYTIGSLSATTLAAGTSAAFTVTPRTGLAVGSHDETITVSTDKGTSATIAVKFTVENAPAINVARIGSQNYTTLQAALDAVTEGQTIQILSSVTEAVVTQENGDSYTLDLNGKTLTNDDPDGNTIDHIGSGTLIVTDSIGGGMVMATGENGFAIVNEADGTVTVTGRVTVSATGQSGTYQSGMAIVQNASSMTGMVNVEGSATVRSAHGIAIAIGGGRVKVSGDALVTSDNGNEDEGTIWIADVPQNSPANVLTVSGGRVENTASPEGWSVHFYYEETGVTTENISDYYSHTGGTVGRVYPPMPIKTYTITASAGAGGTISPSGSVSVGRGENRIFTISANSGYQIASVSVDGTEQGAVSTYTFNNVTENHTISAVFSKNSSGGGGSNGGGGGGGSSAGNGSSSKDKATATTTTSTATAEDGSQVTTGVTTNPATGQTVTTEVKKDAAGNVIDAQASVAASGTTALNDGQAQNNIAVDGSLINQAVDAADSPVPVGISVELPNEELAAQFNNSEVQNVTVNLTIPDTVTNNGKVNINYMIIKKATVEAAKAAEKGLTVTVKDEKGNVDCVWTINGQELKASTSPATDINLALIITPVKKLPSEKESIKAVVAVMDAELKGLNLDFGHSGILPSVVRVRIPAGNEAGIIPGDVVYLYHYNSISKNLEALSGNQYIVEEDGFVTIALTHCSDYVLLPQQAEVSQAVRQSGVLGYTIKGGDTLEKISRKYGCTVEQILLLNPGVDIYNLEVGSVLIIPAS